MTNPLVSICIPTYNGAKYLDEALNSAINQTYRPLEIIISDDASADQSLEIAESYKCKTDIPFFIYNHEPSGIGSNWNYCVEKAKGEWIKFLFQDDLLNPTCVEEMMGKPRVDSNTSLVVCKRKIWMEKSNSDSHELWAKRWIERYSNLFAKLPIPIKKILNGNELLKSLNEHNLFQNNFGEPTATLIRKRDLLESGGFDNELKQTLDIEAWYRLIRDKKIGLIEQELVTFRLHEKQASFYNNQTSLSERKVFMQKALLNLDSYLSTITKAKIHLQLNLPQISRILKRFSW
ncbi:MAG: glycosyltransferase family 2 protein [Cyclobacteriaceae bacterium]